MKSGSESQRKTDGRDQKNGEGYVDGAADARVLREFGERRTGKEPCGIGEGGDRQQNDHLERSVQMKGVFHQDKAGE